MDPTDAVAAVTFLGSGMNRLLMDSGLRGPMPTIPISVILLLAMALAAVAPSSAREARCAARYAFPARIDLPTSISAGPLAGGSVVISPAFPWNPTQQAWREGA